METEILQKIYQELINNVDFLIVGIVVLSGYIAARIKKPFLGVTLKKVYRVILVSIVPVSIYAFTMKKDIGIILISLFFTLGLYDVILKWVSAKLGFIRPNEDRQATGVGGDNPPPDKDEKRP